MRSVLTHSLAFALLLLFGCVIGPLEKPAYEEIQSGQAAIQLTDIEASLGQGLAIGILGGFRTIIADFLWLRLNTYWEERDRAKVTTLISLVTTLDPGPVFFWMNAARITAYDMPNWRIREEGGYEKVPESRWRAIDQEQANIAFDLLEQALHYHSEDPAIYLEIGQIHLNRLQSPEGAAPWFLRASKLPDAPFYAARIYADLLCRMGREPEAYAFLKALYPKLPADNPFAQRPIVLERISTLEMELGVPTGLRFRPLQP